jgi:hypothetical protein
MTSASTQITNPITVPVERLAEPLGAASLSRSRMLPVIDPLVSLLPDGGLVRGKAVACGGVAAMSLALSLAVAATASGSWLAVVDVPTLGLEAAEEFGIPLERVVGVDIPGSGRCPGIPDSERWAELVAATFDGFEVVITAVPSRLTAVLARRVQARMQSRQGVLIALGAAQTNGPFPVDVELRADEPRWEGVATGWGHLRGRRVTVSSSGRRVPRPHRVSLWLPGADGTVHVAEPVADIVPLAQQPAG